MAYLASFLSPYPVALMIHILCAALLIGSSVVLPLARRALIGATTTRELATWLTFTRQATSWHPIAALVLLISGGYMGTVSEFYRDGWFLVAIAGWIANATLAARVLQPTAARLGAALGRNADVAITPEMDALRRSTAWTLTEDAMRAVDIALLFLMVNKPSFFDSIAVVLGFLLIAAAARLALHARGARAVQPVAIS